MIYMAPSHYEDTSFVVYGTLCYVSAGARDSRLKTSWHTSKNWAEQWTTHGLQAVGARRRARWAGVDMCDMMGLAFGHGGGRVKGGSKTGWAMWMCNGSQGKKLEAGSRSRAKEDDFTECAVD